MTDSIKPGFIKQMRDLLVGLKKEKDVVDHKLDTTNRKIVDLTHEWVRSHPTGVLTGVSAVDGSIPTELPRVRDPERIVVKAQNVHDYFVKHAKEHGWEDLRSFVSVRPPFPSMLVTYDHAEKHMDVFINEHTPDWLAGYLKPEYVSNNLQKVRQMELLEFIAATKPSRYAACEVLVNGLEVPGIWAVALDEMGTVKVFSDIGWIQILSPDQVADTVEAGITAGELESFYAMHGSIALATLQFMNCRNVEVLDNPPSRQQRRLAEREGKPAPLTYKTLRILPYARRKPAGDLPIQAPDSTALHICRGHFKDFREGPGLGKYHAKGVWWWHPQVRGSAERGEVKKDYEVVAEDSTKQGGRGDET